MVRLGSRAVRMQEVIRVRHRTPYSLVDVKQVCVESLARRWHGQELVVGVDVAKGELVACVVGPDRSFERPWRIGSPGQIGAVTTTLAELARHCRLVVAMESSGTYGDAFRQALADAGIAVRRGRAQAGEGYNETVDGGPGPHHRQDAAGHRPPGPRGAGAPPGGGGGS